MCMNPLTMLSPGAALIKGSKGLGAISPAIGIVKALGGKKDKKPQPTMNSPASQGGY